MIKLKKNNINNLTLNKHLNLYIKICNHPQMEKDHQLIPQEW